MLLTNQRRYQKISGTFFDFNIPENAFLDNILADVSCLVGATGHLAVKLGGRISTAKVTTGQRRTVREERASRACRAGSIVLPD